MHEIVLSCGKINMTERELTANLHLVDMMVPKLMSQFFLQSGKTAHQLLIASLFIYPNINTVFVVASCTMAGTRPPIFSKSIVISLFV